MTAFELWFAFAERHLFVSTLWVVLGAGAVALFTPIFVVRRDKQKHD